MTRAEFKLLLPDLPRASGVYQFISATNEILYIGKAKVLAKRLASYFSPKLADKRRKTKLMVKAAVRIEYTLVDTEQDALLLEATLIRKHRPKYNIALKWTRPYPYICIKNEPFPRVLVEYERLKDGARYFGPYTSQRQLNTLTELIRTLFQTRTCAYHLSQENIQTGKFKVCLEYHIKNCKAPCVNLETNTEYNHKIEQIANILKGNFSQVRKYLNDKIETYVENLEFEQAHYAQQQLKSFENYQSKSTVVNPDIRDVDVFTLYTSSPENPPVRAFVNFLKIVEGAVINSFNTELSQHTEAEPAQMLAFAILALREQFESTAKELVLPFSVKLPDTSLKITLPQIGDKKKLLELSYKNVEFFALQQQKNTLNRAQQQTKSEILLAQLQKDLRVKELPVHIECFDNSNLQGTNPVSAMVVFKNARPAKRDYRHYNVQTVVGANDFATMQEVVYRRYKRLLESKQPLPQLVIVDGGRGQLNAALESLKQLGLESQFTIVGIAKRLEEIYFPEDALPLLLSKKSTSLKLIQQLRDEAHRFGISFHRDQRSKAFINTQLTQIKGIGDKTAELLLQHFESVDVVSKSSLEALQGVLKPALAKKVFEHFHPQG
jgi:excinuclease ABC subunit C